MNLRKNKSFKLRPMTEDDLTQVMRIELRSFPSPWSTLAYAMELRHNADASYLVLETQQDGILGYIGSWFLDDSAQIIRVAIAQEHRGQGWARRLVDAACKTSIEKGIFEISLEVRESNTAAISCYTNMGFCEVDRLSNYYSHPCEDAVCMLKLLKE